MLKRSICGTVCLGGRRATRARFPRSLKGLLALALGFAPLACIGQSAGVNQAGPGYLHSSAGLESVSPAGSEAARKVEEMRRADRRQRVINGSARLLTLSAELKAEIDRTPGDQLSVSAMRKAAEIEKLARDVKDALKN